MCINNAKMKMKIEKLDNALFVVPKRHTRSGILEVVILRKSEISSDEALIAIVNKAAFKAFNISRFHSANYLGFKF